MDNSNLLKKLSDFDDKSLLIVDDDNPFRERLARAMEKKGFKVTQAEGVKKGIESVKANKPGFAVVDLRLTDGNGLEVVKEIQNSNLKSRIVMLTGYGNISTAVAGTAAYETGDRTSSYTTSYGGFTSHDNGNTRKDFFYFMLLNSFFYCNYIG